MRTRSVLAHLASLILFVSIAPLSAKVFQLPGGPVDLQDVSSTVEVYYRAMRFNYASNAWNFELVLRNTAVAPLTGPVVALVESYQNSTGPIGTEGQDEQGKGFYILTSQVGTGLLTGQESASRTLALGRSAGNPALTLRIYAPRAPVGPALAFARVLDQWGQPLGTAVAEQSGPEGQATRRVDMVAGVVTLGKGAGTNLFRFTADGYLPVWRQRSLVPGVVSELISPRLTRRAAATTVGPGAATVTNSAGNLKLDIPAGVFGGVSTVSLTPLAAQSLPALLPAGWSPLQAFWVECGAEPQGALNCQFDLWGALLSGETGALVRWNPAALQWEVVDLVQGSGASRLSVTLPRSGAWALVVGDTGASAPPGAQVGNALVAAAGAVPDYTSLTINSSVNPSSSAPNLNPEFVTADTSVVWSNRAGGLVSGTVLRGRVTESYQMRDGSVRYTPDYETWFVGYQRPWSRQPAVLQSIFPLRPLRLAGPEELVLGVVNVDLLPPTSFAGAVFSAQGGGITNGAVRITAVPGALSQMEAVHLTALETTNYTGLAGQGAEIVSAFQVTVGDLGTNQPLRVQVAGAAANSLFVLARVLYEQGVYGLEPAERLATDGTGVFSSLEPVSGPRLKGLTASGQYVLAKVSAAQTLVIGVARDAQTNAAGGLVVRVEPWVAISDADGTYRLLAPAGSTTVGVFDPGTGNTAGTTITVPPAVPVFSVPDQVTGSVGPRVLAVSPVNGATNVPAVTSISVTFSKPLNPGTVVGEAVRLLARGTGAAPASVSLTLRGDQATLLPTEPLQTDTPYTLTLATNIADLAGLLLQGPREFGFTTAPEPFVRDTAAQLITYEPTNGVMRMQGTVGFAQPGRPVVLLNETSGRTTTVLADRDGSFARDLAAGADDEVSVTVVNQNGSRDRVTPNRQIFGDGSVALFPGGGTLEITGETGVTEFKIEPGAIGSKTRLKIEAVPVTQVLNVVSNVQPEFGGKVLGGFKIAPIQGSQLSRSMDVSFPINLTNVLPAGVSPTNCGFGLTIVRFVDGDPVYELVDRMVYEDGKLVTHSPPFFGLLGPYEDILVAPLLMFLNYTPMAVHGQVYAQEWDGVTDRAIEGAEKQYLPGAIVSGRVLAGGDIRGRLRPGAVYTVSGQEGKFAFYVPARVDTPTPYAGLEASHARFPGVKERTAIPDLSNGDRFVIGNIITRKDIVFPVLPGSQYAPPTITVSHAPESPEPLQEAVVTVLISAADTPPEVGVVVDAVQPLVRGGSISRNDVTILEDGAETVTPRTRRQRFKVKSARAGLVLLRVHSLEVNGSTEPVLHPVVFGAIPPQPRENPPAADPNDKTGPRVVAMFPSPNSKGHQVGEPVYLLFDEPLRREILDQPLAFSISPDAGRARMDLSPDQRELRLDLPDLEPGTNYTITIGFYARDLNDNPLDQDPSTEGNQPFVGRFTMAPVVSRDITEIAPNGGISAFVQGSRAYVLERQGTSRGRLVILDVSRPSQPVRLSEYSLPQFPRDMVFIPQYSYATTNAAEMLSPYDITLNDITNVVTRDLVAVVGGLSGLGQYQWLRILDVTDPASPQWVAGTIVGADGLTLPGRLRWEPPTLGYVETGSPDRISLVNLQAFIIAQLLIPNQPAYKKLPADGYHGLDLDGDGSYTGPGEKLPLPAHFPIDFGGKVAVLIVPDTTQGIVDFTLGNGGGFVGAILDGGLVRGPNGLGDPARPLMPCYRTLESTGTELPRELASQTISNGLPRRLFTLFHYSLEVSNVISTRDLALVTVRGTDGTNYLDVVDITDRLSVKMLAEIPLERSFPEEAIGSIVQRTDGLLAIGADRQMFLIDPGLLGAVHDGTTRHPAIVGTIPDMGGFARGFGSETTGVHVSADIDGKARIAQTAPRISFVRFPETTPFLPSGLVGNTTVSNQQLFAKIQFVDALQPARLREFGNCPAGFVTNLDARAHYYVLMQAPGGAGAEIQFALQTLNEAGRPVRPKGMLFPAVHGINTNALLQLGQLPGTNDAPVRSLQAWRLSEDPASPFFNYYLSRPFVTVAEEISRQELAQLRAQLDRDVFWSGRWVRASLDPAEQANVVLGAYASTVDLGERVLQPGTEKVVEAFPADLIVSPNPGPNVGEMLLPTALDSLSVHNRELVINTTDLLLPGRRMPIEFRRTYRGQSLYEGPFGRGWDFNFNQRLVENPEECLTITARQNEADSEVARRADLLFYNGGGEVVIFRYAGTNAPAEIAADPLIQQLNWIPRVAAFYLPPPGLFSPMFRFKDGRYVRLEPDGKQYWFNALGRLDKIYDRYDKNSIELSYNERGELAVIFDELRRKLELGYYRAPGDSLYRPGIDEQTTRAAWFGKIARLKDYSGRDCLYRYDDSGLLQARLSPEITTFAPGGFTGRQEVAYAYSGGDQPGRSAMSLIGLRGPEVGGVPALMVGSTGEGGRDAVGQIAVGGRTMTVSSTFPNTAKDLSAGGGRTTVRNGDDTTSEIMLDSFGRATNAVTTHPSGLSQTNRQEFYTNGLVKAVISAEGDRTEFYYDFGNASLRSRGNLLRIRKVPGPRGGPVLEASTQYDPWYNLAAGEKRDFNNVPATIVLRGDRRDVERITRGGERELFGVNEYGQLETHTSIDGINTLIQYDAGTGFVVSRKVGDAQTRLSYAPISAGASDPGLRGKPSQVIDPDNIPTTFVHNEVDQVVSEERAGSKVTHAYDAIGNLVRRVTSVEQGRDVVEEFAYLPMGFLKEHRVKDVETGDGVIDLVTSYEPDAMHRVRKVTMPTGEEQIFRYDQAGRLQAEEVPGSHTNVFSYDGNGNTIALSRAGVSEHYIYDGHDRRVAIVAANGSTNLFLYDGNGNVTTNRIVARDGTLLSETQTEYDALNRAWRFTQVRDDGPATAWMTFNSGERSVAVTDARRATATTYLDELGRPKLFVTPNQQVAFTNDLRGNLRGKSTTESDGTYSESYRYNSRNQLEAVVDGTGKETLYTVELDGRIKAMKDRKGQVTSKEYTLLGETEQLIKPNLVSRTNEFSIGRHVSGISDALGNEMLFQFDNLDRLTTNTLPNRQATIFEDFTPQGEPRRIRMPRGVTVEIGYDFEGKMTNRVIRAGALTHQESVSFDGLRRPEFLSDPSGTTQFKYDLGGYVKEVASEYRFRSEPTTAPNLNFTVKQKADAANFRSELSYADGGLKLAYGRDVTGRLTSLAPSAGEPVIQTNLWVGDSRLGTRILGANRIRMEMAYDALRRVVGRRYVRASDGHVLSETRYAYDANGAVIARQHVHRGGRTDLFQSDGGNNLRRADVDARPGLNGGEPGRTFPGFAVPEGLAGNWQPGAYARAAQYSTADVLSELRTANPSGMATVLPMATNFGVPDAFLCVTNLDGFTRQVDEVGNVTRTLLSVRLPDGSGPALVPATLIYNALGQLERVERQDGVRVYHEYNQAGLRIRRAVTGPASLCTPADVAFIYDGVKLLEERDLANGSALLRRYYYADDGDELVAMDARADSTQPLARYYLLTDQQRSVTAITDAAGQPIERAIYDPWGQVILQSADTQPPAISSIRRETNGLLVVFSEPVLPAADAGQLAALLTTLPALSQSLSLVAGGNTVPGQWYLDDSLALAGHGSAVRFVAGDALAGSAQVRVNAGGVRDDWGNTNAAISATVDLSRPAGSVLFTGVPAGSTAPRVIGHSSTGSAMLFHGQLYDWDTGLLYCRARYYDPFSGMFLQRDPAGYDDSVNQYAGFANNPVNFRDPTGTSITETLSDAGNEVSGVGREMQKDGPVWYWIGTKVEAIGSLMQLPKAAQEGWDLLGQEGQGGTLEMLNKIRAAEVVAGAGLAARAGKATIKSIASALASGARGMRNGITSRWARWRSVRQVREALRGEGMAHFEAAGTVDFAYFLKQHYRAEQVEVAVRGFGEKKDWRRFAREMGVGGKPEWAKSKTGPQAVLRLVIQWGKERISRMFTGDIDMFYIKVDGRTLANDEVLALLPRYNNSVARQHQRLGAAGRPSAASLHGAHANYPELHGSALNQNHLGHYLKVKREGSGEAVYEADFNPTAHQHDDHLLQIIGKSTSPDVFAIRLDSSGQVSFYRPDVAAVRRAMEETSDRLYHRTGKSLHDYGWFDKLK